MANWVAIASPDDLVDKGIFSILQLEYLSEERKLSLLADIKETISDRVTARILTELGDEAGRELEQLLERNDGEAIAVLLERYEIDPVTITAEESFYYKFQLINAVAHNETLDTTEVVVTEVTTEVSDAAPQEKNEYRISESNLASTDIFELLGLKEISSEARQKLGPGFYHIIQNRITARIRDLLDDPNKVEHFTDLSATGSNESLTSFLAENNIDLISITEDETLVLKRELIELVRGVNVTIEQ